MKRFLRGYSIFLVCLTFFICCAVNSFAYIDCDGQINIYEWEDCERTLLFRGTNGSGNAYHSMSVNHKYIEEDRRIYLGILLENINSQASKLPENTASEIYISFNNSSEIVLRSDLTAEYDENAFFVNFGYRDDSFGGSSYEVECVLKELEYDDILTLNISAKDYNGETTQLYQISVKSEEKKEEESLSVAESEKEAEKESKKAQKEKTTKKPRTTKPKTTKEKETTTEFITVHITEDYETYYEKTEKNNRSIIIIGVACVVTSVAAVCVSVFQKEKKK